MQPVWTNPYAAAAQPQILWAPAPYAFVRGDELTLHGSAELPAMCCKCGCLDSLQAPTRELTYRPGWSYLFFFLGVLPGFLAVALTSKSATLPVPLCPACEARWRSATVLRAMLLVAALGVGFGTIAGGALLRSPEVVAAGVAAFFTLPLLVAVVLRITVVPRAMVTAAEITSHAVTLRGLSPFVLATYPRT